MHAAVASNKSPLRSVTVGVALEWAIHSDANVIGLLLAELGQLCTQSRQVQICDLLIQSFGQQIDIVLVCLGLLPILQEIQLTQDLICERTRHDKRRMASGASEIQQPASRQDDHPM